MPQHEPRWTEPYCGVSHLRIPFEVGGWQFIVADYGRFADAHVYLIGSTELAAEKTFFRKHHGEKYIDKAKEFLEEQARLRNVLPAMSNLGQGGEPKSPHVVDGDSPVQTGAEKSAPVLTGIWEDL